jgi:hypothetical protein
MKMKLVLGGLSALLFVGSAIAQTVDPQIKFTSTSSTPASVTVGDSSTPVTYSAYFATLKNGGGSELNQVKIKFTTSVTAKLTNAVVVGTYPAATCSPLTATSTVIECDFGSGYAPGSEISTPAIIVRTPSFIGTPTAGEQAAQKIFVDVTATFREGKSTSASPSSLGFTRAPQIVTPVAPFSDTLDSLVIKGGGQFFTGKNGAPNATDKQTTVVNFPPLPSIDYETIKIEEKAITEGDSLSQCTVLDVFSTCYATFLTAPAVIYGVADGHLSEKIRVFKSSLLKGAATRLDTVTWYYTPTDASGTPLNVAPTPIGICESGPTPRTDGIPCQTKPVICFKNNTAPTPDLVDVCEWEFINRSNGMIRPLL